MTWKPEGEWSRGYDGHRRAQATMGLRLTPAERLRWLEEAREGLRRWQGRARHAARSDRPAGPSARTDPVEKREA